MKEETLPSFEETEELPSFEQTEALPAFEDTEEEVTSVSEITTPSKAEGLLPSEVRGTLTGAAIGATPGAITEIGGALAEKVAEARSPYTKEQLKNIYENYNLLKTLEPSEVMGQVGEVFSEQNKLINQLEKEAYSKLKEPITKQEYESSVIKSSLPFTREVDPSTSEFLKAKEELTPTLQTTNPFEKQKAEQLEKFASKKASDIIENKRTANLGMIPEEQLLQEYTTLKEQIKQTKEGFTFKPNLEKALQDYKKETENLKISKELGEKAAVEKLETPLAKQFPELKGRLFSSAYSEVENDLVNILSKYKPGEKLKGEDAYKLVRDIRQAVFNKDGQLKLGEDASKAAQRAIRDLVGEKNPEASELFKQMSDEINKLKQIEKTGYLKRDTKVSKESPEFIEFGKKQQSKIIKDIAPNLYESGVDVSGDVAKRLSELKKALPDDLYKKLELAVLKVAMEDPKKQATISNFDLAVSMVSPKFAGSKYLGKLVSSPTGSLQTYRLGKGLRKLAKPLTIAGATAGGLVGGIAAQAAEEAFDAETSGATSDMPEYWLERGIRDPEEQIERARLSSFRKDLPDMGKVSDIPSPFEKPEIRQRKEETLAAKKAGALAPTYVEKPMKQVLKSDNPAEISSFAQALQSSSDRASQEYGRVLSQVANATPRERDSLLFGLNQQPAFRQLVRQLRGQEMGDEEEELPYIKGSTDLY